MCFQEQKRIEDEKNRLDAEARERNKARNKDQFEKYVQYLEDYYGDDSLRAMSESVRGIIQEWMMANR